MSVGIPRQILHWLQGQRSALEDLIGQLVAMETPSTVPQAQRPILHFLSRTLEGLRFRCRLVPGNRTGGHLIAYPDSRERRQPWQLLLGHCDTVWPLGTLETMPLRRRGERMYGPGIFDMKSGLAQMVFALRALEALGLTPRVTPILLINSDEEIGSRESRRHIIRLARIANRALVLEPSLGPEGRLKTARKGVGRFTITIRGRAAHAGLNPEQGASAILELSHVIQELYALNDPRRGISINVGTIDGGLRPNVIAPLSTATVDVRVLNREDARMVERAIRSLKPVTPGVTLTVEGGIGRPPMERTPANRMLWHLARQLGGELGMELDETTAGGGSDGNFTSLYTATLDGLGAVGDGAHAAHEHILLPPLPQRTALLACLLLAPPLRLGETP